MQDLGLVKAQIEIDFEVNEDIKSDIARKRKLGTLEITKERHFGIMIENMVVLEKALLKKKMSYDELIKFLNTK